MKNDKKCKKCLKCGLFITFEGADGSGKTTQLNLLKEKLEKEGYEVFATLEPGAKGLGEQLRQILLHYNGVVSDRAELFLYLADRAQHIDTIVKPLKQQGKIVLCDRHTDSTVAYQGYGRNLDVETINKLNEFATNNIKPDLTLLYDVKTETAQERVGKTKDRLEAEGFEFHKKVREGYLKIAEQNPERVKIIDANRPVGEVFSDTIKTVLEVLR